MPFRNGILLAGALFSLTNAHAQFVQQGSKLVGTPRSFNPNEGTSVAISVDGNTAIVGAPFEGNGPGAAWIFTRANGVWTQQAKLVGIGAVDGAIGANQGFAVALSADGNTALVGGPFDSSGLGAAWVFTRSGGTWSQQGGKLVGSGNVGGASLGHSVALSADGSTALLGGWADNGYVGAVWVFTNINGVWTQQGDKLVGSPYIPGTISNAPGSYVPAVQEGSSVALSEDGSTAVIGGSQDNNQGALWIFTRSGGVWSQQSGKLTPADGLPGQFGSSVAISPDGNTVLAGGPLSNGNAGGAWVFTRSGTTWSQQGPQLAGSGASGPAYQGTGVGLSGDGNTAIVGGYGDNNFIGAAWIFTRSGRAWTQQGYKLVGSGAIGGAIRQGESVAISGDSSTAIVGGVYDDMGVGAVWIFTQPVAPEPPAPGYVSPGWGGGASQSMVFTFNDPRGWQDLDVVNILISNFLDGRQACYLAYSRPFNVLYLVNDAGTALSTGLMPGGSGAIGNGQCAVSASGFSVTGSGTTLILALNISFTPVFNGNRVIYLAARDAADANNSGWQAMGSWAVE